MTYDEYIAYHLGGDAGVEERMIASLAAHFKLSRWDSFRLAYYYTTTYHIPSALKLLRNHNTPKVELKFRTDRRYVRIGDTFTRLQAQLSPKLLEQLDEATTTTEQYNIVSSWYFFGRYATCKYGGVDRITNAKGSSCTSELANVVKRGLAQRDIIFCEGSFMNTFGMNLTNAMFEADKHLVVNLYADTRTLWNRLNERSKGKNGNGRDFAKVVNKQKQAAIAAVKWHEIGVKVLQINTAEYSPEQIVDTIYGVLARL